MVNDSSLSYPSYECGVNFRTSFFLLAFSAGWGWWLYWWLFRDAPLSANRISLLLAAGISLQILLIGNLAFADFTIHQIFWIPIAVGLAGVVHAGRNYRAFASLDRR